MKRIILVFSLLAAVTIRLQAGLITFDDLPAPMDVVPNGYAGFNWQNAVYADPVDLGLVPSGYFAGLVSGTNVLTNAYESPLTFTSTTAAFRLDSLWLTGAWNDDLHVHLEGYRSGLLICTADYVVNSTGPTFVTPGFLGVDSVVISSYGGEANPDYAWLGGAGANVVIDSVSTSAIPEPSTYAMYGVAGLLALIACRRWAGKG